MRIAHILLAALGALVAATPAAACLPPPPGMPEPPPPTPAQWADGIFRGSGHIVEGEIVRGSNARGIARFKVLHVYKGTLRPGQVVDAYPGSPFDGPPCPGMMIPLPLVKGDRGTFAFSGVPAELRFVRREWLDAMIAAGRIAPRR